MAAVATATVPTTAVVTAATAVVATAVVTAAVVTSGVAAVVTAAVHAVTTVVVTPRAAAPVGVMDPGAATVQQPAKSHLANVRTPERVTVRYVYHSNPDHRLALVSATRVD